MYIVVHRFQYCLMYETIFYKLSMYGKKPKNFIELFDCVSPLRNIKTYLLKRFWAGPWSTNTFLTTASVENLYKSGCSLPRSLPDNTEIIEIMKTGKTGGKVCGCVISSNLIKQIFHLIGFHGSLQNPKKITSPEFKHITLLLRMERMYAGQ